MPEYRLIEEPEAVVPLLGNRNILGVDTEFVRERTFFAELCLVQVAAGSDIYCIDTLCGSSAESLWACLAARDWVVHSARQDLEVFYQTAHRMPQRIFDTQIAAALLGYAPQLGYAALAKELFGADIAKSHTRADWSKRPLGTAMLEYAAEDVEHLLPAHEVLSDKLERLGRLNWAYEDSALLLDPALYTVDAATAIDRLKAARNLRGRRRAAAARLAAWRESEAIRANRPRQWILRDALLLAIATALPARLAELQGIEGLAPGLLRRCGDELLEIIAASARDQDDYRPAAPPTEAQKSQLKRLQERVSARAGELGIAAEVLASRRDLAAIVSGNTGPSRALEGWRRDLIGDDLLALAGSR